jgi:hypothetical protein
MAIYSTFVELLKPETRTFKMIDTKAGGADIYKWRLLRG